MFNIPTPPDALNEFYSGFFKDSSSLLILIFTGFLAWFTYELAKYTKILARETEWARLESGRPDIVVVFDASLASRRFIDLHITNVGRGTAENIVLEPQVEIFYRLEDTVEEKKMNEKSFLKIPLLKPNQSVRTTIGRWGLIHPTSSEWLVKYTCLGISPKRLEKRMTVSMDYMKDIVLLGKDDSRVVAESAQKMANSLEKIIQPSFEMRVRHRTDNEAQADELKQLEHFHSMLNAEKEIGPENA